MPFCANVAIRDCYGCGENLADDDGNDCFPHGKTDCNEGGPELPIAESLDTYQKPSKQHKEETCNLIDRPKGDES